MKTLIVYATKYGYTKKCVDILVNKLKGDVDTCNLNIEKINDLSTYENIIIGGPIYISKLPKSLRKFCRRNLEVLKTKRIGLFITCLREKEAAHNQLLTAFPQALIDVALVKDCFGGEIIYQQLNFFDRLITNMVSKSKEMDFPQLDEEKKVIRYEIEHINNFSKQFLSYIE